MSVNKNISLLDKMVNKTAVEHGSNKETMLMLSAPERKEEVEILKKIGLDTHIQEVETTLNDINRIKIISEKLNRKAYYGHQIKDLCSEYNLKLLRADNFKGKLPKEVGQSVLNFIKENTFTQEKNENRTIEKTNLNIVESSFFVLSTKKSFQGKIIESATLFYRDNEGKYDRAEDNDVFVEVFSWGKPYKIKSGEMFIDIFRNGDDPNWNLLTFFILIGFFFGSMGSDTSSPYVWLILYLISTIILIFSTYKNKNLKWNQTEN